MRLMSGPSRVALLVLSTILCSLSLTSHIDSCLFSNCKPSKFFDKQVSSISTEKLVLSCHICCVLSRLCYNKHNLLLSSYFFRIDRIENPSCSTCDHPSENTTFHLILYCPSTDSAPLAFWQLSIFLQFLVQALGGCSGSWSSAMPPSLRMAWVKIRTTTAKGNNLVIGFF